MPKLTNEQKRQIEELALKLYDKYNPRYQIKINVAKDKCIREAEKRLGFKKR